MTAWLWACASLVGAFVLAAAGDLISEEIRGWLDLAPHAILRLAAAQLDAAQRETIYQDEWLPELTYALRGAEARPITRLITGIRYATGILIAAHRVARRLNRTPQHAKSGSSGTVSASGRFVGRRGLGQHTYVLTNASGRTISFKSRLGYDVGPHTEVLIMGLTDQDIRECEEKGLKVQLRLSSPWRKAVQ